MKKMFFLAFVAFAFLVCGLNGHAAVSQRTVHAQSGFVYNPDYRSVDWGDLRGRDVPFTSFEDQGIYLVVVRHNVYFIPSDFFFENIYDLDLPLRFYPAQHFCDWWGVSGYNFIWDRYYFYNHRTYYRPHYNYYLDHRNYQSNFLLHQNEFRRLRKQRGNRFNTGHSDFHSYPPFMRDHHSENNPGYFRKKRDNHNH